MKTNKMTSEIRQKIELHQMWHHGEKGGKRADLSGEDLSGLDLSGLTISGAKLIGTNFSNTDLRNANFQYTVLYGANFCEANISNANFMEARLSYVNMSGADAKCTNFCDTDISYALFREVNFHATNLSGSTIFNTELGGTDLNKANLFGVTANNIYIRSVPTDKYHVAYTHDMLYIGHEVRKIEDWWELDISEIPKMDNKMAIDWWRRWKPILMEIIRSVPCYPTIVKK